MCRFSNLLGRRIRTEVVLTLFLSAACSAIQAQTITVTTSRDVVDIAANARIADLPGPDGVVSFREALRVSDNEPGRQTIGFAIPESDWYLPNIFPGQVLLQSSFNWSAFQPVTIDGTTQTAFSGDTYPGGNEILAYGLTLVLNGEGSALLGFHSSRVLLYGAACEVYNNTGGMYITASQGGDGANIHDNEAFTIAITYCGNNRVVRNTTQRVRISGLGTTNPATGNVIGGPDPADRNFITGFGNYSQHDGTPHGDCIELYYTDNTLIQNNYLGTTPDGMAISNPACTIGVAMYNSNHNAFIRDNLIAVLGIGVYPSEGVPFGQGIYMDLWEGGSGIEITGNTMGLNALGEPTLGGVYGIRVSENAFEEGATVTIGGPNPGQGNVIAGHISTGVLMYFGPGVPQTGHIRLSGNSIYGNGGIGIDLMPDTWTFGVTSNDALDADAGANGLQNFPEVASATREGGGIHVVGTLRSRANRNYAIEFFGSPSCDPSGHGPGQVYLGSTAVTTDAGGNAAFDVSLAASVPDGWVMTSTATFEPRGDTSEFSACTAVIGDPVVGDIDGDGDVDLADLALLLSAFGACSGDPQFNVGADFDGSGCVELNDLAVLLAHFGT